MILKYDEALSKAENPEWFKGFYKKDEISDDETVNELNELINKLGGDNVIKGYFDVTELVLLKMYEDDFFDYLYDLEDELNNK